MADADAIVRITADCPLIDPQVLDSMVDRFERRRPTVDYLSNCMRRTFPRGLDVEVFSRSALDRTAKEAAEPFEREHVTPYMYGHPERFTLENYARGGEDLSEMRLTLDEPADFAMLDEVFCSFGEADPVFATLDDVLAAVRGRDLQRINAGVRQKALDE